MEIPGTSPSRQPSYASPLGLLRHALFVSEKKPSPEHGPGRRERARQLAPFAFSRRFRAGRLAVGANIPAKRVRGFARVPSKPKTAILLVAGRARRLGRLTDDRPKCLLRVGHRTLIEHQVDALRNAGIEHFVIVTGYRATMVEAVVGRAAEYVRNEIYDRTNSLYSLALALPRARNGFVLTNGDVLFHPRLLESLVEGPHRDALLYEPGEDLGDEEMKVRIEDGRVTAMGKTLPAGTYHGENLGVLKFSAAGAERLEAAARALVEQRDVNAWAPKAVDLICREHPIHAVSSRGFPWIEIDFEADLERARRVIWPQIEVDVVAPRERPADL